MSIDINENSGVSEAEKQSKLESLQIQGSWLVDLCLYFVVPGTQLELLKNGKNIRVDYSNIDDYIPMLIQAITKDFVHLQLQAFTKGF